jgi:hypothetical protein
MALGQQPEVDCGRLAARTEQSNQSIIDTRAPVDARRRAA